MKKDILLLDGASGTHLWNMAEEQGFAKDPVWKYNVDHPELVKRLAEEYNLPIVDHAEAAKKYSLNHTGYGGPSKTSAEKEASFLKMLDKLEAGKTYMFLDHPALDNEEMQTVGHIG